MSELKIAPEFDSIIAKAREIKKPMRVVMAGADSEQILQGLFAAQEAGFADPILVGNYKKINAMLEKLGLSDRDFDLQPVSNDTNAVQYAIEMISAGSADTLLRGNTQTRDFLLPILNKTNHLIEKDSLLSHVVILKVPGYDKLLAVSDVTILPEPSLEQKVKIIQNMTVVLKAVGIERPKIALLTMVEKPSFHIRSTVEAQTIVMNHNEEPIADCELVGPISYDLIVSKEAARLKNFDCECCGEFDGTLAPALMAGNLLVKVLERNAGAVGFGLLMGANIPIAITSRSDDMSQAYLSLAACAALQHDKLIRK